MSGSFSCLSISRAEFVKAYFGSEMDPNWSEKVAQMGVRWKKFVENDSGQVTDIRREIAALAMESGVPIDDYRRIVQTVQKGERGEQSQCQTDDGRPGPRRDAAEPFRREPIFGQHHGHS